MIFHYLTHYLHYLPLSCPLSSIIFHYLPLSSIIFHYLPLSSIIFHYLPLSSIIFRGRRGCTVDGPGRAQDRARPKHKACMAEPSRGPRFGRAEAGHAELGPIAGPGRAGAQGRARPSRGPRLGQAEPGPRPVRGGPSRPDLDFGFPKKLNAQHEKTEIKHSKEDPQIGANGTPQLAHSRRRFSG